MSAHVFGRGWSAGKCPGVIFLLAFIVGSFLVEKFLGFPRRAVFELFALSWDGLSGGRCWQLLTHALLHEGWWHLAINMLGLWFAGRRLEPLLGTARFLTLFVTATIIGGFLQVWLGPLNSVIIGASAGLCGIVVGFATAFPNLWIKLPLFFPLRFPAKYLGWMIFAPSLLFVLTGWQPEIGNAAHLGGCITGFLWLKISGFGARQKSLRGIFRHQKIQ